MDKISKILYIASFVIILLILGMGGAYLFSKTSSGNNPVQNIVDKISGKKEPLVLPEWNPATNASQYTDYYSDGPALIGTDKTDGSKKILYYQGIVKQFDPKTNNLIIEFKDKTSTLNLGNGAIAVNFVYQSQKGDRVEEKTINDIKIGQSIKITGHQNNSLVIIVEIRQ